MFGESSNDGFTGQLCIMVSILITDIASRPSSLAFLEVMSLLVTESLDLNIFVWIPPHEEKMSVLVFCKVVWPIKISYIYSVKYSLEIHSWISQPFSYYAW